MRLNTLILLFCLLALPFALQAQTARDSVHVTAPKFIIQNDKDQILLMYDKNRQAWEVPGSVYEGNISFKNLADSVSAELGVKTKHLQLAGMFTYHYPNKYRNIIRPYFVLTYEKNAPTPASAGEKVGWFSWEEAQNLVPYPASVLILNKIHQDPQAVWGAAFIEYGYTNPMVDKSKITFKIVEDFYRLQ
ncbi:hypothetical protein LX64_01250 [Chitinophaga skermanii]|uniref:ADP-ribose pyrophosphatase YjhB (NUDIX family) n=1 Tax=Chitinophaga skermanii TaxID=331697 RepID=A0A327R3Z3_9BACT|nr:NUDIX hydrolase [Chitinophaga skermanii]RAJ08597.1 hypothetical protein LX64_01250 [Chitinophaga skermanii]